MSASLSRVAGSKRRSPRLRRLVPMALLAVGVLLVVAAGPSVGQINDPVDSRNKNCGELAGCNAAQDCWLHHRAEGMRDAFVVVPIVPQQLKRGEEAMVEVQIINMWKNHVRGLELKVNLINAEGETAGLFIPGASGAGSAGGPQNDVINKEGVFEVGQNAEPPPRLLIPFEVELGAAQVSAVVQLSYRDAAPNAPNFEAGAELRLLGPSHTQGIRLEPERQYREPIKNRTLTDKEMREGGFGTWHLSFEWQGGPVPGNQVIYSAQIVVDYGGGAAAGTSFTIPSLDANQVIDPGTDLLVEFPVVGTIEGTQTMEFQVRGATQYLTEHTDGVTPNWENYTRFNTVQVAIGPEFIPSLVTRSAVAPAGDDLRFVLGEVTGFATAILLLPSLLLGGTFGRGSRKMFNRMLGGAKRRVMYHSLVSLGITAAAVVHIIMFLLEIRYSLLMGMMWGGLAALSLMVLGLTGYYQVPLIQKHGYKWWRYTHLVFGVLVLFFAGWHSIVDGPDFVFVRDALPQWLTGINLAEK